MSFGRVILGSSVLLLLSNCSSYIDPEKYALHNVDVDQPAPSDAAAKKKIARKMHRIAVHRPVASAPSDRGATKSATEPSAVQQDQAPTRLSSDGPASAGESDPAVVEAALGHRKPKFSIPAGSIEQMAKEDPESVALKSKTNICRGC